MTRVPSIILLSGGLDSAANLAICREQDEPVLALTARYGQRAADPEVLAAQRLCEYYDVRHQIVDLSWIGGLGGSALTSFDKVPELKTSELDDPVVTRESAKLVWVPNRNGILINVAAAYAEHLNAKRVVVGFNREEAATFPDNSVSFVRAATDSLRFSTANQTELFSYTAELDKREIVAKLRALARPFPFDLIWSCYLSGERPCGLCESCRRQARALGM